MVGGLGGEVKNGDDSSKAEHRVRGRMRFFERFEPDRRSSNWNANDNEWGGSSVLENLVRTFAKPVPDDRWPTISQR